MKRQKAQKLSNKKLSNISHQKLRKGEIRLKAECLEEGVKQKRRKETKKLPFSCEKKLLKTHFQHELVSLLAAY